MWEYILIVFISIFLGIVLWNYLSRRKNLDVDGKHVYITGASSGIGFCIAKQVAKNGGKVTLIARDLKKLEIAKTKLISLCNEENVCIQSVDISQNEDALDASVKEAERIHGPIYMLVNCAGIAFSTEFDKLDMAQVKSMFGVKFLGAFYLTQLATKSMKQNSIKGKIVFVSSMAGLFGFYGYSTYAGSNAAVNKLAEALHQELKPFGISITVALPPDTDTPGYQEEKDAKPIECHKISDSAGLYQPEDVARCILNDVANEKFYSTTGFNGYLLASMCADMTPVSSFFDLCFQVIFGGPLRLLGVCYLFMYDRMIQAEHNKKMRK